MNATDGHDRGGRAQLSGAFTTPRWLRDLGRSSWLLVGVLALHASAAQMGYLGAALLFPNLLFSLHAGAWVDRAGRRPGYPEVP